MKNWSRSRYRILEPIGSGGMGVVYKAEDTRLKRVVALKLLSKDITGTGEAAERFEREAQAAAALDHPNICTVYEIDNHEGETFLTMAYLEGESLDKKIEQGPLPLDSAYAIARQAAEGLAAAHTAGVVHRDIKSSNIMLSEDRAGKPVAKLMDFGLAQVTGASRLTQMESRVGTTAYMSPEQSLGDQVDSRTDLWSLGVVLHEMVTGELPFKGHYDQAVLYSILNEEPEPVTSLRSRVPMELEWIIEKCLAKTPADRYQDARELIVDIERLQRRSAAGRTSIQPIARSSELPPEPVAAAAPVGQGGPAKLVSKRGVSAVVAAALVAAAFAAGLFVSGGAHHAPDATRRFTLRPVGSLADGQSIWAAAVSPDGRNIAYTTSGAAGALWIQPLDRHEPYKVDGADGARSVFWSPDSRFLGFTTAAGIGKLALRGLGVSLLVEDPNLSLASAAWSPDGQSIIFAGAGLQLSRVSALGGAPRPLFDVPVRRRGMVRGIAVIGVSDDEEVLLYSVHTSDADMVQARRLSGGEAGPPVELLPGAAPVYSSTGHLLFRPSLTTSALWAVEFSPEDLELQGEAFAVSQNASDVSFAQDGTLVFLDNPFTGQMGLSWVGPDGTQIGEIGKPQSWIVGPRLSPSGGRVLTTAGTGRDLDLWVHETDRPVLNRVTFDEAEETGAVWSPDGDSVAFTQRGSQELKLLPVGSGRPASAIFTWTDQILSPLDWSRDGRYILLQARRFPAGAQPGGLPSRQADAPQELLQKDNRLRDGNLTSIGFIERPDDGSAWEFTDFLPPVPFVVDDAVFSPDGNYVAYESNESGNFEVYVRPFPSGERRWQVTTEGGRLARWSPEGDKLYFIRGDTLMAASVSTQDGFVAGEAEERFSRDSFMALRRYPTYDVGAGGRIAIAGRIGGPTRQEMRVTQNWFSEFRKP